MDWGANKGLKANEYTFYCSLEAGLSFKRTRILVNSPPTLTGAGHQWTVNTNTSCNQWLSLAKPVLKVAHASRHRSLVLRTSKCMWAISWPQDFMSLTPSVKRPSITMSFCQ